MATLNRLYSRVDRKTEDSRVLQAFDEALRTRGKSRWDVAVAELQFQSFVGDRRSCRGGLCGIRPPPRTDTGDDCSTYRFKGESITSYFTHYHSGGDNQRQPMISPLRLLSCGAASFQPGRRPPTVDGRLEGGPAPPRWPTGPVAVTWNVFHWKPIVYDPGKEGGVSPAVARRSVA